MLARSPGGGLAASGRTANLQHSTSSKSASIHQHASEELIKAASQVQDKKGLAMQLLVEGRPQAFVDFFLLTHTSGGGGGVAGWAAAAMQQSGRSPPEPPAELPLESLLFLQQQTVRAHNAVRTSDARAAFEAYKQLGRYFGQLSQLDKAASFYEKCLQVSRNGCWPEGELEASAALGATYEALHQSELAVVAQERCLDLATSLQQQEAAQAAYHGLVTVYAQQAELREARGDEEGALELLGRCLKAAAKINDAGAAGQISHRIGLIHQRQGEWHKALACHASFLAASRAAGDRRGEGAACCAHAECQQQLGDLEGAVASLETYLEIARGQEARGQAVACCKLGAIHYGQGRWEQAVSRYEHAFELARGLPDRRLLDAVRTNLGIARAALREGAYFQAVAAGELGALLSMKANPTGVGRADAA